MSSNLAKSKLILLATLCITYSGYAGKAKIHEYSISSVEDMSPEKFRSLTGQHIDSNCVIGLDLDGTVVDQHKKFKAKYHHKLISRWNDHSYTKKHYGKIFKTQKDALEYYNERLSSNLESMKKESRSKVLGNSTSETIKSYNSLGALSMGVTLRDGFFENFKDEANDHSINMSLKNFGKNLTPEIDISGSTEKKLLSERKIKKLKQSNIKVLYKDGVIYTGWRRTKGLAMRKFLTENDILESYHSKQPQKYKKLVFFDNEKKNFDEIKDALSDYFEDIYFIHIKK